MANINNTQKVTKINGNCKGVRCTTDGSYFHAVKEAAISANVTFQAMSYAIRHKKPCKGKMYRFESETEKNMMEMASNLGEYCAKAAKWDAYQAELKAEEERLEAERKAEEKRQAQISKLEDKVERLETLIDKKAKERQKLVDERNQVLADLKALLNESEVA